MRRARSQAQRLLFRARQLFSSFDETPSPKESVGASPGAAAAGNAGDACQKAVAARDDRELKEALAAWRDDRATGPGLDLLLQLAAELPEHGLTEEFERELRREARCQPALMAALRTILFHRRRDAELLQAWDEPAAALRSILSVPAWGRRDPGSRLTEFGAPEHVRLVYPKTPSAPARVAWQIANAPYLAEIAAATVVGGSGLIAVGEDYVLSDILAHPLHGGSVRIHGDPAALAKRDDAVLFRTRQPAEALAAASNLCGFASEHFGHWVADFLPRVRLLSHHPEFDRLPILVDEGMPESHYESLSFLTSAPLHRVAHGERVRVDRLIVAPAPTFLPVHLAPRHRATPDELGALVPSDMRFLRERVLARMPAVEGRGRRLFLTRGSRWRNVVNEDEIVRALTPFGFETVALERLNFREQVETMQQASILVAPNGSAMNNFIFARPEARMLILSQPDLRNWGGWLGPMQDLGYDPHFIIGELAGEATVKFGSYMVPIERIMDALSSSGGGTNARD